MVPDSRTGPDAGENANQRTDLPPYRHWWYVPLLCRSAAGGDLRPGEAGVVCDEREFSLQCLKKRNAFRSVRIAFDRLLFPDWTSGLYCLHNPAGTGGHDVL